MKPAPLPEDEITVWQRRCMELRDQLLRELSAVQNRIIGIELAIAIVEADEPDE